VQRASVDQKNRMAWIILFIAGGFEVAWAVGLKYTQGFTKPMASAVTLVLMITSLYLLSIAQRNLPIGTAYPIWTGIGAFGTAVLGIYLFNEPATLARISFLALIIIGIVGLRFTGGI
jgi:quaternary ammonium compound-resistance protein SugE